jgi:hypothetical protein
MEMVSDATLVIPSLISIYVAKIVGDLLSKPLFMCLLDFKAMPYLDRDPKVVVAGKQ